LRIDDGMEDCLRERKRIRRKKERKRMKEREKIKL